MDPRDKVTMNKILELEEENNKMLKRIRGSQKTARMFKVIYWVIIIGLALGAYYYVKPVYESVVNVYTQNADILKGINLPDVSRVESLLDTFKK